jgi:hypothetical protein
MFRHREIEGIMYEIMKDSFIPYIIFLRYLGTTLFYDVSYTNYPQFLCSGKLWFAEHDVLVLQRQCCWLITQTIGYFCPFLSKKYRQASNLKL